MFGKMTITYLLLVIVLIDLAHAGFTEVPPPPQRPAHFRSKEELKRYLQKVHEYHAIVSRWRLRRDYFEYPYLSSSTNDLLKSFDMNNDHPISHDQFTQRLKFKKEN